VTTDARAIPVFDDVVTRSEQLAALYRPPTDADAPARSDPP
jgi:hypothetical protein